MNTEELLNQLLPLLQQKLHEQPEENVLDGLIRPTKSNIKPTLVPAHGTNQTGTTPVPEAAKEVISFPRLDNRLSSISIKDLVRNNPEVENGLLRPQEIDTEFLSFFPTEARGRDKQLAKIQREIYVSMRPILFTLNFLESQDVSSKTTAEFADTMVLKLQDTLALSFHAAEGIRIDRRIALAKAAKWSNSLVEACEKVDSSAEGDAELFGPEYRQLFHAEAKNWKPHRYITSVQQRGSSRGGYDRGRGTRGRTRGRGPSNQNGNNGGRSSDSGSQSWGKGYGGGASAAPTSDK